MKPLLVYSKLLPGSHNSFTDVRAAMRRSSGEGGTAQILVDPRPFQPGVTPKTVGNYWPYATSVYDYIIRAMPPDVPGSLQPDEVYALVAYLLNANEIIAGDAVMNAETLPRVVMPNVNGFIPGPRPDVP